MPARPDPKNFSHGLLAATDARKAMLEKMRGRLAAPSQASVALAENRRKAARGEILGWGFRIGLALLLIAGNAALFGFREEIATVAKERRVPAITNPKSLALNVQALYWTYALYDFDRLKSRFGAPPNAIQSPEAGFSLVEVLVTMVVLGGLAASVFFFLSSQSGMGTRSNDLIRGLNLGKLGMDSLKVSGYAALEAGSDTVADRYIRSWRVSVVTDGDGNPNGRKKIDLSVHWPMTADHVISFTFYNPTTTRLITTATFPDSIVAITDHTVYDTLAVIDTLAKVQILSWK